MASEPITAMASAPAAETARWGPNIARAGRVAAAAVILGAVGQLLFFAVGLGINFPLAIGLLLLGGWLVRRRTPRLREFDAWLAPAALAFAALAAIRADPTIVALDLLTSLALAGAALTAFGGLRVVERPFAEVLGVGLRALGWASGGAVPVITGARGALPPIASLGHRGGPALPVLRGLAIAIPLVVIFIALFSAADAVFARVVDDVFGFEIDLGDVPGRIVTMAVIAWVAAGGLALAAADHHEPEAASPAAPGWRIGTTEVVTVLIAVAAVFVVFVVFQATYLFGGLDTLASTGLTYAEYARRGFFELVVVAVLAGGLIIGAERLSAARTRLVVGVAIGLALLTGVVIASAALRLRLYQEAYGWTELRLYVLATICLLAIAAIALLVQLAADRVRWFGHVLTAGALAIGLALNLIGPVRFITEQNVARVLDPRLVPPNGRSGLDDAYALSLGDDAIPALVRVLPHLDGPEAEAPYLAEMLSVRLGALLSDPGLNAWQAWNAGRNAARDALEAADARGELP
ncbi:MAG: DUF4173 domain-containing protein [Chloroflexota bacterium]